MARAALGHGLMGRHPDRLPREVMAWEGDLAVISCVSDLPLRITGNLKAMAAFAGQSCADRYPTEPGRPHRNDPA